MIITPAPGSSINAVPLPGNPNAKLIIIQEPNGNQIQIQLDQENARQLAAQLTSGLIVPSMSLPPIPFPGLPSNNGGNS